MYYQGYIKLYRQLKECEDIWLNDEPFDRRSAWVDLLLTANHREKNLLFNGKPMTIERGQMLTSILILSERWKWSRHKVSDFLNVLEYNGMIEQVRDNKKTLITIVNYSVYQSSDSDEGQQTDIKRTSKGHQKDTNNNDKECIKNDKYISAFEELWKIYPRKVDKGRAYKCYQARLNSGFSEEELLTATTNYANECKRNNTDTKYIKHASTFFSDSTPFVDYLKGETIGTNQRNSSEGESEFRRTFKENRVAFGIK